MNGDLTTILLDDLNLDPDRLTNPDSTLDDAGFDSLTIVELSVLLGERFDIQVNETDIRAAATLAGLDDLVGHARDEHARR